MKTILTINCGDRAEACAQGLACAIFNASEMEILDPLVGARYQGPNVNIVVDDEDFEKANPKQIFSALSKAMGFVIKASKEGFDGSSPEEMLDVFSYPDEGTGFYSNVKDKVDLTVADLEFLQKELTSAVNSKSEDFNTKMNIGEAIKILGKAGLIAESVKMPALYDLEKFFNELRDVLDQKGYGLESFADFEEDLDNAGYVILFTEDKNVNNLDGLYDKIERKIASIKRKLSRRWTAFDIDYYSEDERIFVTISVDDLSE